MAHDNTRPLRQFQSAPFARAASQDAPPSQPQQNGDPLAELARLIGQSDPFADFGRKSAPAPEHRSAAPAAREAPAPRDRHFLEPRLVEPEPPDWRAPMPQEPAVKLSPRPLASIFPERYREPPPADVEPEFEERDPPVFDPAALRREAGAGSEDVAPEMATMAAEQRPEAEYDTEQEPYTAEESYADPAPARRRGGVVALLAVLALAVVGTAGAFGYRAMFGNSGPIGPPPVIRADQSPNKVVPAPQASESQSSKLIYDRVGDRSQGEKVVAREEQPLTIAEPKPQPRSVFPGVTPAPALPGAFPPGNASAAPVQPQPNPAPVSTEPKRVRTVVIRPDQPAGLPDVAPSRPPPPVAAPQRAASPPPPAPSPAASSRVASVPTPLPPPAPAAAAPEPPPGAREPVRPVARNPAPAAAAPSANAPLSLAPPANSAVPPARVAAAPTNIRPQAPAVANGSYMVQVTSQRSESEAQNAFRSLQARFPRQLGDRQAVVRRADLGERGTFYRAQVGPFASSAEAGEFCSSLKAAGGQCVVQRN